MSDSAALRDGGSWGTRMETTKQDSQSEHVVRLHEGMRVIPDSGKTEEGGGDQRRAGSDLGSVRQVGVS